MRDITADKNSLIETIKQNRDEHRAKFLRAQENYRARAIAEMDRHLEQARNGGVIDFFFNLPEPQDHTKDYDNAIEMLSLHKGDEVQLSEADVRVYVRDDWGWKQQFNTTNAIYAVE